MSQTWKQTKLEMGAWKTRPRGGDGQEPARDSPTTTNPVSLKRSLQPSSSTSSLKRKSPESSSPLSEIIFNQPSPKSGSKSPSPIITSNAPTIQESLPMNPPSNLSNTFPKSANLSFTSSQLPLSSGSQRVVRNGEKMVTNSDDDDDSSSLEDLDDVLGLKKPIIPDPFAPPEYTSRTGSGSIKHDSRYGKTVRNISAAPKTPNYKYSLAALAQQHQQLQKSEVDVARINATLEGRRRAPSNNGQTDSVKGPPNESVLDAVMSRNGDEEDVGRLKEALRRTEALHQDPAWSFFHPEISINTPPQFPNLNDHPLQSILRDRRSRQQAFLNGYMEDYAMKHGLPDELLDWILECSCFEAREDLRLSYIQVLAEIGSRREFLSPRVIDRSFRCIGARNEALDLGKPVVPSFTVDKDAEDATQDRLISTLTLIRNLSSTMKLDSKVHAICILCRLLLDHRVIYDCNLITALEDTLNNLIESIAEDSQESKLHQALLKVYESVIDPKLRLQLVSHLPAFDIRTAVFRRRLALAFFYEDTKFLKISATEAMIDLDSIAAYLQTPRFKISKKMDYAELTSNLALLDIGIDGGDPPLQFTSKKDERRFDDAVDRLSMRLKDMSSHIIGVSALDMRRTEAKEKLHAMQRRLTYAVRSQPYVKKSFLAPSEIDHDSEKKGMSEYLNSTKAGVADNPLVDTPGVDVN